MMLITRSGKMQAKHGHGATKSKQMTGTDLQVQSRAKDYKALIENTDEWKCKQNTGGELEISAIKNLKECRNVKGYHRSVTEGNVYVYKLQSKG